MNKDKIKPKQKKKSLRDSFQALQNIKPIKQKQNQNSIKQLHKQFNQTQLQQFKTDNLINFSLKQLHYQHQHQQQPIKPMTKISVIQQDLSQNQNQSQVKFSNQEILTQTKKQQKFDKQQHCQKNKENDLKEQTICESYQSQSQSYQKNIQENKQKNKKSIPSFQFVISVKQQVHQTKMKPSQTKQADLNSINIIQFNQDQLSYKNQNQKQQIYLKFDPSDLQTLNSPMKQTVVSPKIKNQLLLSNKEQNQLTNKGNSINIDIKNINTQIQLKKQKQKKINDNQIKSSQFRNARQYLDFCKPAKSRTDFIQDLKTLSFTKTQLAQLKQKQKQQKTNIETNTFSNKKKSTYHKELKQPFKKKAQLQYFNQKSQEELNSSKIQQSYPVKQFQVNKQLISKIIDTINFNFNQKNNQINKKEMSYFERQKQKFDFQMKKTEFMCNLIKHFNYQDLIKDTNASNQFKETRKNKKYQNK